MEYAANCEQRRQYQRDYRKKNIEHVRLLERKKAKRLRKTRCAYAKKRRAADPLFRLAHCLRSTMNIALKRRQFINKP